MASASAEYERRTAALSGSIAVVAVEAHAQVGDEALDGVAQLGPVEQVVLDDPPGEHAVADLVAQPGIVLAEQVEEGGQQLGGGSPRRDLGVGIDDGLPQGTIRNETHASSVLHPRRARVRWQRRSGGGAGATGHGGPRGRRGHGGGTAVRCHTWPMRRRPQLIPWKAAGRVTEEQASADEVVQATGWVFNNETGDTLTLAEFVATGDSEVAVYVERFGLGDGEEDQRKLVEIGCGIGRMTCAFTRRFGTVIACDLDHGFLERCREAVARFGKVERLRTIEVGDGRTLRIDDDTADVAFSYITLQHCERDDALALVAEAVRVVRPGGQIALNFRSWSGFDPVVLPLGAGRAGAVPGARRSGRG